MAKRYTRLFSLPENLYTEGAPVLIAAGALLRDNTTDTVLAQLKLKNIGEREICAVTVIIHSFDPAGRPLGEPVRHTYLDLCVKRDGDFGQKNLAALPDKTARSYTVTVTEVVFWDGSIWTGTDTPWEPLERQKTLAEYFGDIQLAEQYGIELGAPYKLAPAEQSDLWFCACGAVNRETEMICHRCRTEKNFVFDLLDPLFLKKESDRCLNEKAEESIRLRMEKKKKLKFGIMSVSAGVLCLSMIFIIAKFIIPSARYSKAIRYTKDGRYDEAISIYVSLDNYKDCADRLTETQNMAYAAEPERLVVAYQEAEVQPTEQAALAFGNIKNDDYARERSFILWREIIEYETLSAGGYHSVGLREDGTVVAVGSNEYGQCNVEDWTDIVSVSTGYGHTVGLKEDGTVVATGKNDDGQCNISGWDDIVAIAAGDNFTIGLRSDGRLVATGSNSSGQCNVDSWNNVVSISAGSSHTVALKVDGSVLATGYNGYKQCNVKKWKDITKVTAGTLHTVGLKGDGTVVVAGDKFRKDIADWTNIATIKAGSDKTVALSNYGKLYLDGYYEFNEEREIECWENIIDISPGLLHTLGLKSDGTVVAASIGREQYDYGQCNVEEWTDIMVPQKNNAE